MLDEYDFRGGVRGKYADRLQGGSVAVLLDPDVAEMVPDPRAVNEALRALAAVIQAHERRLRPKMDAS